MPRPRRCHDAVEVIEAISRHFESSAAAGQPPTLAGLGLELGLTREQVSRYMASDEYGELIVDARQQIEAQREALLLTRNHTQGVQFALNAAHGWATKSEAKTEVTTLQVGWQDNPALTFDPSRMPKPHEEGD